jgi:dipeptidyl aminopeptidase/acylaminoacyl peptidase
MGLRNSQKHITFLEEVMKRRACRRSGIAVICVLLIHCAQIQAQNKPALSVAMIMRDPKWLGSFPQNPYWSEDGRTLYFEWNPEGHPADSLYQVSRSGGTPARVPWLVRKDLPAPGGEYSRNAGKKVFERAGDIFLLDTKTGKSLQITNTVPQEGNPCFSFSEEAVIFAGEHNLFSWKIATGELVQLTDFRSGSEPPEKNRSTDAQKYLAEAELRLLDVLRERKHKRESSERMNKALEPQRPRTIYLGEDTIDNLQLSPDEKFVTFRLQRRPANTRTAQVPAYVTETGFTEDMATRVKAGETTSTYRFGFWDIAADTVLYFKTDGLPAISTPHAFTTLPARKDSVKLPVAFFGNNRSNNGVNSDTREVIWHGPFWSDNGKLAFVVVLSLDNKDRWLALLDLPEANLTVIDHQSDEAWIGGPSVGGRWSAGELGWMPDNESVWFCSETSGYAHLYTVNTKTLRKQALTSGDFEVSSPFISRDKKHWYFTSNEGNPGEYHFYTMPIWGGAGIRLTTLAGKNEATLSPDETMIAIRHSKAHEPWEIYLQPNKPGAVAQRVTHSTTEEFKRYPWRRPEFITYAARDGKPVHARLYRPEKANGAAVIFVHGAGYLQNAHTGWSYYFREYMFHNLLADRGYTVLDPDYRASAGYGRDWRTAIYRHMGGKDLEDIVDGATFLIENHDIDPKRVGIYGGSYGGFITLMAMFTTPDVFAAGAALRPVTDWAHYNPSYTSSILNIPQVDTLAYRRSSPIYFAEGLKGALLICHGMVDVNVHFQDTVRLVQRLIELGKETGRWRFIRSRIMPSKRRARGGMNTSAF